MEFDKKIQNHMKTFNYIVSKPLIAAIAGFGIYILYEDMMGGGFIPVLVGLYIAALLRDKMR